MAAAATDDKALKLHGFRIDSIGDIFANLGFARAHATLALQHSDVDAQSSIAFDMEIKYEPHWTIDQVRQAAYEQIRLLLRSANHLVDAIPLQELQRASDALRQSAVQSPLDQGPEE
jgi:hypothetical protein